MRRLAVTLGLTVLAGFAMTTRPARGDSIDNLYANWDGMWSVHPFYAQWLNVHYYAQTFIALPGLAYDLTFAMKDDSSSASPPADLIFRVLLAETTGSTLNPGIGNILFESSPLRLEGASDYRAFTIDVGGIDLVDGSTYAWILDPYSDYESGYQSLSAALAFTGAPATPAYENGHFMSLTIANDGRARSEHLLADWQDHTGSSMAFEITFDERHIDRPLPSQDGGNDVSGVPEPSSFVVLTGLGAMGLVIACRNRRRTA